MARLLLSTFILDSTSDKTGVYTVPLLLEIIGNHHPKYHLYLLYVLAKLRTDFSLNNHCKHIFCRLVQVLCRLQVCSKKEDCLTAALRL